MKRIFALCLFASPAFAAPPQNADPALAPWFQSLKQPKSGASCCSIADCRPVRYRIMGTDYEAFLDRETFGNSAPNQWTKVPPEVILRQRENPTGDGVLCFSFGRILCFIRGPET